MIITIVLIDKSTIFLHETKKLSETEVGSTRTQLKEREVRLTMRLGFVRLMMWFAYQGDQPKPIVVSGGLSQHHSLLMITDELLRNTI